ncbi:MAG: PQQ-binding-like beta-propeller repeat protein [Polyangiaceae bacterium]
MERIERAAVLLALAGLVGGCGLPAPRAGIVGERIVVQARHHAPIAVIDGHTGDKVFVASGDGLVDGAPTDGRLVFLHGDGGLYARDISSGTVAWRVFTKIDYAARAVVTKKAVFVPVEGLLGSEGLMREAPPPVWAGFKKDTGEHVLDLACDAGAPLATNDDILVTFEHAELVGYNAEDGKERWRSTLAGVRPPVLVSGGFLYARVDDEEIGSFNAASGALREKVKLGGTDAFSGFLGTQPHVAATGGTLVWIEGGALHAADGESGKELWSHAGVEVMTVGDGAAYVAVGKDLAALDLATGTERWKLTLAKSLENLSAGQGAVAARVSGDEVIVIDAATGKVRFGFDLAAGARAPDEDGGARGARGHRRQQILHRPNARIGRHG